MKGAAPAHQVDAATIVRGLLDPSSDAGMLLDLAACNEIELHADRATWNAILRLIAQTLGGTPSAYGGEDFAALMQALPVTFA